MKAYASGVSERPLSGETIGDCLAATARTFPDGLALVSRDQGIRLSWRELSDRTEALALGSVGDRHRAG